MMRRAMVAVLAVTALMAVWAAPASALPGYTDVGYRCDGAPPEAVIKQLEDPTAKTTWAHWGVPDYTGYGGDLFASTKVTVVSLDSGWFGGPPVVDRPVPEDEDVVRCYHPYSGATALLVFHDDIPEDPPPGALRTGLDAPGAGQERYKRWVVRSHADEQGCFLASSRDDEDALLRFCDDDEPPQLWDVIDADLRKEGRVRIKVKGTLTDLHGTAEQ